MIVFLVFFLTLFGFYNFYYKRRNLPPGPIPYPLIGNLLSLAGSPPEKCFLKWEKKYGGVFTFWFGETPVICVTDYQTMVNTFQKDGDAYTGRIKSVDMDDLIRNGKHGIVITDGEIWRDHRRFMLQVFRGFGMGKNVMQEKILQEVSAMFERINDELNTTSEITMANHFDISVGSVINAIIFGYRFDGDKKEEFYTLKSYMVKLINKFRTLPMRIAALKPSFFVHVPFLKRILIDCKDIMTLFYEFFDKQIHEHVGFCFMKAEPTDFVGAYLAEKERRDKLGDLHSYTLEQLKNVCFDLWVAGQETTTSTLAWGLAFLLNNSRVMDKMHEELDRVIGSKRLITIADKLALPYTNAVINEIQRSTNLVSVNLLHRTTRDVKINEYFIPKDTVIVPQISALLSNEKIFPNPMEFRPERFLNESGELMKYSELLPFSIGKRQCPGESLARMELYLFIANIFNNYKVTIVKIIGIF